MGACFMSFGREEPDHTSYGDLLDSWDFEHCDKLARENDIPIDIVFEDYIYDAANISRSDPIPIPKKIR